jgi:hypothetical protein
MKQSLGASLRAAREDGAPDRTRADVWEKVERASWGAAGANGGNHGLSRTFATSSVKGAFLGAAVGSALSFAVVAVVLLRGSPASKAVNGNTRRTHTSVPTAFPSGDELPLRSDFPPVPSAEAAIASAPPAASASRRSRERRSSATDALSLEVRILTAARGAIQRGDPEGALAKLKALHRMRSRQLEPEGRALEAQALRALGRASD